MLAGAIQVVGLLAMSIALCLAIGLMLGLAIGGMVWLALGVELEWTQQRRADRQTPPKPERRSTGGDR
jgi:hypothetical protein